MKIDYVRIPIEVCAVQYFKAGWDGSAPPAFHAAVEVTENGAFINTPEGRMKVAEGDWVVRGVRHEYYPVKPDIFALTYEKLEEKAPWDFPTMKTRKELEAKELSEFLENNPHVPVSRESSPAERASSSLSSPCEINHVSPAERDNPFLSDEDLIKYKQ